MNPTRYTMMYRPASYATLPSGLVWNLVENPKAYPVNRPDLPASSYPFGVFVTNREITPAELEDFQIQALP